jgi:ATP-dependent exoDNAse (exonuclease V) beta subunit
MTAFTDEQLRTIGRRDGSLLVRAGAGTGKTSVLVERFVRAVSEDGVDVDSILAITFTEKAAAEMKLRVRRAFVELGRRDDARAAEAAWISTIHGFCSRVLRAHALTAGIDPDYRVLDELESERLGIDAFDRSLEAFLEDPADSRRLEMVAAYTPDRLREMVRTAWSRLRSRGQRRPRLEPVEAPSPAGERERLEAAAAAALRELGACGGGQRVSEAVERVERCGSLLARIGPGVLAEPAELGRLAVGRGAKALHGPECEEYRDALTAYARLCADHRQYLDRELLRELLDRYGEQLGRLKRARSGLDFEDLELMARDLLRDHAGLREQYAGRFSHVLVDEFQDTNPLQNELFRLLCGESMSGASPNGEGPGRPRLFLVGDENQSIYGFRNADVDVFRRHHAAAAEQDRAESLTINFRARGELLDAIDIAFASVWGEEFEPLRPGPNAWEKAGSVELLVADRGPDAWKDLGEEPFGPGLRSTPVWRAAEARLLARRISELHERFQWGDIVVLLRATTHMNVYERALEERGVPTHVVGGRGYWSQQQVADLRHWLAALANPLDELAVYSVLASPLVGCSLDALALVGIASRRAGRGVWRTLREAGSNGLLDSLPEADRRRVTDFVGRFEAERRAAPGISLETLIDRAITLTGYDRRVLPLPAGDRRLANVRKLMRMAREYEADEGRDLRGFIDFVAERDLIQEREGEAPLEAEQLDAVRLMTVHRAKGLEFPVVCVADLGKEGRDDRGPLRISEDGSLGLRLASLSGTPVDTEELERIKKEQRLRAEEEEKRIFYVAATRAQEHLVLSGATDLSKLPEQQPLQEPMRWIWRGFCPDLAGGEAQGVSVGEWDGREVRVRYERCTVATIEELLPPADRRPARPAPKAAPEEITPPLELGTVPVPRALPVNRLSYSGLARYRSCSYRFYLERALRLESSVEPGALEPPGADEFPALLRGTVVHELLEKLEMRRPAVPSERQVEELIERYGAEVRAEDVADIRELVEGFVASPLRRRLASARRVRTELPFAFTLVPDGPRSLLVNGVVDVHALEEERTLIVDYKSDRLEGADPAEYCEERYGVQRLVYALAALRAGAERVEVAYVFLEQPSDPVARVFEPADAKRLDDELRELARGLVEGRFEPTSEPHLELCHDCPGRAALCSWDEDRTLRPLERC